MKTTFPERNPLTVQANGTAFPVYTHPY